MSGFLRDLAVFCGAIVVVISAVMLVARLPPVRWLWRRLVSDPLTTWAASTIKRGALEFHDETVRPQITAIEDTVNMILASETSWAKDKAWLVGRVSQLELRADQADAERNRLLRGVTAVLEKGEAPLADVLQEVSEALNGKSP